ncbi:MAG: response regulator [Pseudomonadota bacterium]
MNTLLDRNQLERLRVLLLDDSKTMRGLLRGLLNSMGVKDVFEAGHAADALEVIKNERPDVAIVDYRLPDLDGLELTTILRRGADSPNRFIPIILCSAHLSVQVLRQAMNCGVDEFLVKPVSAADVRSKFEAVILKRREFVETPTYFGPCRRRGMVQSYNGPWRRATDAERTDSANDDADEADQWLAFKTPELKTYK